MNEIKRAQQTSSEANKKAQAVPAPDQRGGEIRLLDDYELVLAGGGDSIISWP